MGNVSLSLSKEQKEILHNLIAQSKLIEACNLLMLNLKKNSDFYIEIYCYKKAIKEIKNFERKLMRQNKKYTHTKNEESIAISLFITKKLVEISFS